MSKSVNGEPSLAELKIEMIVKSSNCCCICQTPFIHIHHIDGNNKNNTIDNLAPLCPNHHALAHSKNNMTLNLTPERIKAARDKWYKFVETRRQTKGLNLGMGKLRVKNFVSSRLTSEWPSKSWAKTFSSVDPGYSSLTVNEIIDRVFSDSNPENLKLYLTTMKIIYANALRKADLQSEFKDICKTFGFDYDGKNVI
jgi:hypothetical protein